MARIILSAKDSAEIAENLKKFQGQIDDGELELVYIEDTSEAFKTKLADCLVDNDEMVGMPIIVDTKNDEVLSCKVVGKVNVILDGST